MEYKPFIICAPGCRPPAPRKMGTTEGLGDRMRTAAFAEKQAVAAFIWAAEKFTDAPDQLRQDWLNQVPEEEQHCAMIVARMAELGFGLDDREVSLGLWNSLSICTTAAEFCVKIARAEERGRRAGVQLVAYLKSQDPVTAAIFQKIADDEVAHVALAHTYFGWTPDQD